MDKIMNMKLIHPEMSKEKQKYLKLSAIYLADSIY